jgi:hypothetical protein
MMCISTRHHFPTLQAISIFFLAEATRKHRETQILKYVRKTILASFWSVSHGSIQVRYVRDPSHFIKYMLSHALTCLISFFVPSFLATGTVAHASPNYIRDSLGFVQCDPPLPAYRNCNYSRTVRLEAQSPQMVRLP